MQIKRLLWTLFALSVAWGMIYALASALEFDTLIYGSGEGRGVPTISGDRLASGWRFEVEFQPLLLLVLFIAWCVTIYRNLSAPKG